MLLPTAEVQRFLESKGFTRDNSEPFTYVGYSGGDEKFLIIDDAYALQEIEMLIEDSEVCGALDIASALRELLQGHKDNEG